MLSKRLPLKVFQENLQLHNWEETSADPVHTRGDYISHLAWESLGIPPGVSGKEERLGYVA